MPLAALVGYGTKIVAIEMMFRPWLITIVQQEVTDVLNQQTGLARFENVLRTAFEQDEWKLIAVGAILGFMVGEMQAFLAEHLTH